MKAITTAMLAVALVGCGKSDATASFESKENLDKGRAVISQRQKELLESDRKLFEAEEKLHKSSSAPSSK